MAIPAQTLRAPKHPLSGEEARLGREALEAIGVMVLNQRTINLLAGHEQHIMNFAQEYKDDQEGIKLMGLGHRAKNREEFILDGPHSAFWKDSATADWQQTPTGLGTFDNIVTESASQVLRLDQNPDHFAYLASILEIEQRLK